MRVSLGPTANQNSWQDDFPKKTQCHNCYEEALLAFVAHEGIDGTTQPFDNLPEEDINGDPLVKDLYKTTGEPGGLWLHDCCAVAVYFCRHCLSVTAKYDQA